MISISKARFETEAPGELGNGLLGKPMDPRKFSYDARVPSNADRPYRL